MQPRAGVVPTEVTVRVTPACHPKGWRVIAHHDAALPFTTTERTHTLVSTIPATPAETTGEIVLTWSPDGPVVTAPARVAVPVMELFEMRRVPGDPRAVELPGGIRYLIGAAHRRWRGTVYLHRMPQ